MLQIMRTIALHLFAPLIVASWANAQITSGEWTYTLNDSNEATITGYSGAGGAVGIPSALDGKPVKQVGNVNVWPPIFGTGNTTVTSATIPNGVTSIGAYAFYDCTGLTSIDIPNSVTIIGESAFYNCTGLTSVDIPNSVTIIGELAFQNCTGLTSVDIAPGLNLLSIGTAAFEGCPITSPVIVSALTTVMPYAFDNLSIVQKELGTLIAVVASGIIAASPDNYGIATKADLDTVVSNTVAQIQSDPASYNLSTLAQNEARYNEGITAGTSLVTANPASYSLYTSDSIMDLRMNGLMVQKQGGNAEVTFQPQTTADLTQPFTNNGTPVTNTIPMPGNKGFLRIQAK